MSGNKVLAPAARFETYCLSIGLWVVASFAVFLVATSVLRGLHIVAPLASAVTAFCLAGGLVRWSLQPSLRGLLAALLSVGLLGLLAILVASGVRDISFEGQAIHFPSALEIADGLNPLTTGYFSAVYPNGLWTLQGLFISLTPWLDAGLEAGKAPAGLLAVASIPLIAVALRSLRGAWTPAVVVASVLVQANPVMLLQLTSFELDGVVYSLVVTAVAGAILLPTCHRRTGLVALCGAILLLVNTKITGLYWAGLIAPAVLLQAGLDQRTLPVRLMVLLSSVFAIALLIVGWRPYVTVLLGTGEIFGATTEVVLGAANLRDAGPLLRMAFLLFGKSSNPVGAEQAHLKWPGELSSDEFVSLFDIRNGGFGPWFGLQTMGTLLVGGIALWRTRRSVCQGQAWIGPFWTAIVFMASLFFPISWWARLVSPFWLVAVLPLVWRTGNARQTGSWLAVLTRVGWALAMAGVMVNMAAVAVSLTSVMTTNRAITQVLAAVAQDGDAVRIVPSTAPDLDGTSSIWEQRLIRASIYPRVGPATGCRRPLFSAGSVQLCIDEQAP